MLSGPTREAARRTGYFFGPLFGTMVWLFLSSSHAFSSSAAMKGPGAPPHEPAASGQDLETSAVRLAFLGAIELFQKRVSPTDGPRCGLSPSCSAFAREAIRDCGAARGVLMTADRLLRCNIWKEPGVDYFLLPNGRLFDPVSKNRMIE